jgi:hypothetical protein
MKRETMRAPTQPKSRGAAPLCSATLIAAAVLLNACAGLDSTPQGKTTTIYVVRHAEPDFKDPDRPLTDKGRARAEKLVPHFAGIPITHVYSTHTDRTRDTVAPLARAWGLPVAQFPRAGSELEGGIVNNRTSEASAIKPMIAALRSLPSGATVVVACNSSNLYPIMAGVGVRPDASCTVDRTDCVPCVTRECFDDKRFDYVWKVISRRDGQVTLSRTVYGN